MPTMVAGDGSTWTELLYIVALRSPGSPRAGTCPPCNHIRLEKSLGYTRSMLTPQVIDVPVVLQPLRPRKWHTQVKNQNLHV